MIDISEKLGLSGPGREKQDIEYEVDERYDEGGVENWFDYKRFFRKAERTAERLAEVLFEEKNQEKILITGRATRRNVQKDEGGGKLINWKCKQRSMQKNLINQNLAKKI